MIALCLFNPIGKEGRLILNDISKLYKFLGSILFKFYLYSFSNIVFSFHLEKL